MTDDETSNPLLAWYRKHLQPETVRQLARWVAAVKTHGGDSRDPTLRPYIEGVVAATFADPFCLFLAMKYQRNNPALSEWAALLEVVRELGEAYGVVFEEAGA